MKKLMSLILFALGICYFMAMFGGPLNPEDPMIPQDPKRGCPGSCFPTSSSNNCCPVQCPCPPPCICPPSQCCPTQCCPTNCPIVCQSCACGGSFSFDALGNITGTSSAGFVVVRVTPPLSANGLSFRVTFPNPFCNVPGVAASSSLLGNAPTVNGITQSQFTVHLATAAAGSISFVIAPGC